MVYLGQNLDYIREHHPFGSTKVKSNNYPFIGTPCECIEQDFTVLRLFLRLIHMWKSLAKRFIWLSINTFC